jgi:hypothetical protein
MVTVSKKNPGNSRISPLTGSSWQLESFSYNKLLLSAILEWSRDAERLAVSDSLGRVSVVRLAEAEPRVEHLLTGRGS